MRPEPGARNSLAWRYAQDKVRGREAAGYGVWALPTRQSAARGLRPHAAFAACSQPASRPPPWGSPMCRYCVTENRPLAKKRKACFACGASRHVVLHRIAERRTRWPSRLPFGARCAALTE
ncbi:protein of unknown function [Paraburkholderia dioscoreae]|uniref:Uncharacterized protein n=1 Tax=Paraburkholderia dioscoreae TaxID=2604047 RepID=A0A5Q4ZQ50_9BURK|nr:protein of unknown function [Paraburkholderia dioscoreae]